MATLIVMWQHLQALDALEILFSVIQPGWEASMTRMTCRGATEKSTCAAHPHANTRAFPALSTSSSLKSYRLIHVQRTRAVTMRLFILVARHVWPLVHRLPPLIRLKPVHQLFFAGLLVYRL